MRAAVQLLRPLRPLPLGTRPPLSQRLSTAQPRHSAPAAGSPSAAAAAPAGTSAGSSTAGSSSGEQTSTLVVQKFGGTSLGTPEKLEKVVKIVDKWNRQGRVACVVSALSSHTKAEGTTTRLLMAAESAVTQEPFHHYLDAIEDTHLDVIYSMLRKHENRELVKQHVSKELRTVRRFCESLTVIRELSPRSHDMIIGCGERLSAGLIAGVLRENDIPAIYVNLSNLFRTPLNASEMGYHTKAISAIRHYLEREVDVDGVVPVITGYLGDVQGGIIHGIGRGYSDLTAALVAAALRAHCLQVRDTKRRGSLLIG